MPLHLTSGEAINCAMVLVMIATLIYTRRRHSQEDDADGRKELNTHLLECARKNGEVETTLKNMEKDIKRLGRKVDNLSAQFRNQMFGLADTTTVFAPEEEID